MGGQRCPICMCRAVPFGLEVIAGDFSECVASGIPQRDDSPISVSKLQ